MQKSEHSLHKMRGKHEKPSCFLLYVAFQTVLRCAIVFLSRPVSLVRPVFPCPVPFMEQDSEMCWAEGPEHHATARWWKEDGQKGSRVMDAQDSSCLTLTSAYDVLQDSKLQSLSTSYLQHPQQPLHGEGPARNRSLHTVGPCTQ